MAISKPVLPPISGYVEVEVNGARKYRNIKTGELMEMENEQFQRKTTEERIAELENALCDMDAANEEAHATYETALCDLDETLNGGTV